MKGNNSYSVCAASLLLGFLLLTPSLHAQMNMQGRAAMANSVGSLSLGKSVEPKTTFESAPMIRMSVGNLTFMFHANGFVVDIQQNGPRDGHKLFFDQLAPWSRMISVVRVSRSGPCLASNPPQSPSGGLSASAHPLRTLFQVQEDYSDVLSRMWTKPIEIRGMLLDRARDAAGSIASAR